MVPEHDYVALLNLFGPSDCKLDQICKITNINYRKSIENIITYLLPIGKLLELIFVCLNFAKNSSQGAQSYE